VFLGAAAVSAAIGFLTLVPGTLAGLTSDGARLLQLARGGAEDRGEDEAAAVLLDRLLENLPVYSPVARAGVCYEAAWFAAARSRDLAGARAQMRRAERLGGGEGSSARFRAEAAISCLEGHREAALRMAEAARIAMDREGFPGTRALLGRLLDESLARCG
jgi:hypothetical protein